MKNKFYISLFMLSIILLVAPITSGAETWKYNYLEQGETVQFGGNYTINTNSTYNWITNLGALGNVNSAQFDNIGGTLTIDSTYIDANWCALVGCIMEGDLTFSNAAIQNPNYIQFNINYTDGTNEGRLQWNVEDGTLEFGLPGGEVNLQIGQEFLIRVKNEESFKINNGEVVYASTAIGNIKKVKLASASNHTNAMKVVGVATEDIESNEFGYITTIGLVRDFNTSGFQDGQVVYLSTTLGEITATAPDAPDTAVSVGIIVRPHATEGIMFARIHATPYLGELSNVFIDSVNDEDILIWNSTGARWNNINVSNIMDDLYCKLTGCTISGDVNITGSLDYNRAYAQTAYHNETNPVVIDLVTEDVYVNVTGLHLDYNNSIHMDGQAVIEKTSMYQLMGSISFSGGNSGLYRFNLFVNDLEEHACGAMRTTSTNQLGSLSINCVVYLEENDKVNMRVKDTTSLVQDVSLYTVTMNMIEI